IAVSEQNGEERAFPRDGSLRDQVEKPVAIYVSREYVVGSPLKRMGTTGSKGSTAQAPEEGHSLDVVGNHVGDTVPIEIPHHRGTSSDADQRSGQGRQGDGCICGQHVRPGST